MKMVPLGEVAQFVRGVTFKPSDKLDGSAGVPVMRTKNVQTNLDLSDMIRVPSTLVKRESQYLQRGDTLVSSANSWNLVGKCCWVPTLDEPTAIGGFVTALRADRAQCDPRYLYHWFAYPRTQTTVRSLGNQTTNISNLSVKRCLKLSLPLPPLDEQRRIAAILDKADAIRQKRCQAITYAEGLTQSAFAESLRTHASGLKTIALGEVLRSITTGVSPKCESREAAEGEWGVLKLSAVTSGQFLANENKAFLGDPATISRHEVRAGDLLMTRKNTPELVGAAAIASSPPPRRTIPDLVFRLDLNDDFVKATYLQAQLMSPNVRAQVRALSGGSAKSMSNIAGSRLKQLKIQLPSVSSQQHFELQVLRIQKSVNALADQLAMDDELFASLQSRAFRGEL